MVDVKLPPLPESVRSPTRAQAFRRYARAAVALNLSDTQQRLDRIRQLLESVDHRALAADGPVTPAHEEITLDEVRCIYALSCGKEEAWRPTTEQYQQVEVS